MVDLRPLLFLLISTPLLGFNVGDVVFKVENGVRVYGVVFNPLTNTGFTGVAWDDGTQSFPSPNILALLAEKVFGADVNVGDNVIGVQPPNGNTVQGGQIVEFNGALDSARIRWDDDTFSWRGRAWFISSLDLTPEIGAALGEELLVILEEGQFQDIDDALNSIDLRAADAVESLGSLVETNNTIDQELNNIRELMITDEQKQDDIWIELENISEINEDIRDKIDEAVGDLVDQAVLKKINEDLVGMVDPVEGDVPNDPADINPGDELVWKNPGDPRNLEENSGAKGTVVSVNEVTGMVNLLMPNQTTVQAHYTELHDGDGKIYLDYNRLEDLWPIVLPELPEDTFVDMFQARVTIYVVGIQNDIMAKVIELRDIFVDEFDLSEDFLSKLDISGDLPSFNLGIHGGTSVDIDLGAPMYANVFSMMYFLLTFGACWGLVSKTIKEVQLMVAS